MTEVTVGERPTEEWMWTAPAGSTIDNESYGEGLVKHVDGWVLNDYVYGADGLRARHSTVRRIGDRPLFHESLEDYKQRLATVAMGAAYRNGYGSHGAQTRACVEALGCPIRPEIRIGLWVNGFDSDLLGRLPEGTALVMGDAMAPGNFHGVMVKRNGSLATLLGRFVQDCTMQVVAIPGREKPPPVEPETDRIKAFMREAYIAGRALKDRTGWCGEVERAMGRMGLSDYVTRPEFTGGHTAAPAVGFRIGSSREQSDLPVGTILRWSPASSPSQWYFFYRDGSSTNASGTLSLCTHNRFGPSTTSANYHSEADLWWLPGTEMNQPIHSDVELQMMPLGTRLRHTVDGRPRTNVWTKTGQDEWTRTEGSEIGETRTSDRLTIRNLRYVHVPVPSLPEPSITITAGNGLTITGTNIAANPIMTTVNPVHVNTLGEHVNAEEQSDLPEGSIIRWTGEGSEWAFVYRTNESTNVCRTRNLVGTSGQNYSRTRMRCQVVHVGGTEMHIPIGGEREMNRMPEGTVVHNNGNHPQNTWEKRGARWVRTGGTGVERCTSDMFTPLDQYEYTYIPLPGLEVPVEPTPEVPHGMPAIGELIGEVAAGRAPVGTVCRGTHTWTLNERREWYNRTRGVLGNPDWDVLRVVSYPDPPGPVPPGAPPVGEPIGRNFGPNAPAGTVVRGLRTWTMGEDRRWHCPTMSEPLGDPAYGDLIVVSYPVPVVHEDLPPIGGVFTGRDQAERAPVGTVISGGREWTKQADGRWRSETGTVRVGLNWETKQVVSYPPPGLPYGTPLEGAAAQNNLPERSIIAYRTPGEGDDWNLKYRTNTSTHPVNTLYLCGPNGGHYGTSSQTVFWDSRTEMDIPVRNHREMQHMPVGTKMHQGDTYWTKSDSDYWVPDDPEAGITGASASFGTALLRYCHIPMPEDEGFALARRPN